MLAMVAYASQANNEEAVLSDMALENAEALAGDINPNCPNGCLTTQGSYVMVHIRMRKPNGMKMIMNR